MPTTRDAIERRIAEVFAELPAEEWSRRFRSAGSTGGVAWLLVVWPAGEPMPTARAGKVPGGGGPRSACRAAVIELMRAVGKPLKLTSIVNRLADRFGEGTVTKAAADLMRSGELVNPRDRRGYRLAERFGGPPSLFE